MKRQLPFAIAFLGLISVAPCEAYAQDPVAAAAREEAAENYRTLSAKVVRLEEELHSYQSQISKLTSEIYKLRDELDRQKNRNENAATLEKISKLQDAINKVNDERVEDNKRNTAEIAKLRTFIESGFKKVASVAAQAPPPVVEEKRPPVHSDNGPKQPAEGSSEYTIKKGDTLSGIIAGLKSRNYKVTLKQMEEANPNVNWNKLRLGQTIIVPPSSN